MSFISCKTIHRDKFCRVAKKEHENVSIVCVRNAIAPPPFYNTTNLARQRTINLTTTTASLYKNVNQFNKTYIVLINSR